MTGARRYLARLLVVVAITAAVVGLGFVWRSSSAASLVSRGEFGDRQSFAQTQPSSDGSSTNARPPDLHRDGDRGRRDAAGGLSSIDDLGSTMLIGVGVLAGVVLIDTTRRRLKPIDPRR